jgi:hypothetical protein
MVKGGPSINPKGRNAGSRDKICRELLADMADAWELYGIKALKEMAAADPSNFVKAYVGLLPKEVKVDATENMTEDQLLARIRDLAVIVRSAPGPALRPQRSRETAFRGS